MVEAPEVVPLVKPVLMIWLLNVVVVFGVLQMVMFSVDAFIQAVLSIPHHIQTILEVIRLVVKYQAVQAALAQAQV